MSSLPFRVGAPTITSQYPRHVFWTQFFVELVVDLNRRCPTTGSDALDLFQ
jgi:hypothetical protein